jgi:glucose-1-phosphate cytidylyltransferase
MIEIGGRPILWHIMKTYSHYGFRDFVLCLGYRGQAIKDYFLNYQAMNNDFTICLGQERRITFHNNHDEQHFRVTLAETGAETMTGGRLLRAARYLRDDTFLLTYGDGVANIDIAALVEYHKSHGKLATVTSVTPLNRFGVVDIDGDGAVRKFAEKPQLDSPMSGGYFVLNRAVLDYLEGGDECVLERAPLEQLARENQLMAYRHPGFFYAMDTYREYQFLNDLWSRNEAPWKVW